MTKTPGTLKRISLYTFTTDVNATAIKKNKDKDRDKKNLANIEYYNCKQKDYYSNKCLGKELKN